MGDWIGDGCWWLFRGKDGAKVVVSKGKKFIRPLVVIMSMVMALKLLWEQHPQWFQSLF